MKTKLTKPTNLTGRFAVLLVIILAATLLMPDTIFSQWQGNSVTSAINNQINANATSDGNGGSIITWQDKRNGKSEIYAQRMSASGLPMWKFVNISRSQSDVPICILDSSFNPMIVSDGMGGAIIAWESYRGSTTTDIFVQRINSSGVVQWAINGDTVCAVVFNQDSLSMISDGLGGAILTWQDYRSNNGFADIYAQRISPSGAMLWTANGVNICNQAAAQRGPKLVSDGSGGAFITWFDNRAGNYDIYTQRVSSGGAPMYTVNGVATCTMATDQLRPDICSDGAGGVIITWYDYRSTTDYNIYAQRQGPALGIIWAVDGVVMNNNVAYAQTDPKIVSDDMGGAIVSWTDYRTGTTADIYTQRVNSTGAVQWTATGVIICTSVNDQIKSQLVSDGNNGAYIVWEDHRNAGNADIYAQRIASNAVINWAATGFAICTSVFDQLNPMIVSNGNLGAIVVWQDYRSGNNFDIYINGFNTGGMITKVEEISAVPLEYSLSQNYPNPFNPVTQINYQLPKAGNVRLSVFNALGQEIDVLINESQGAGNHVIDWNAASFPSGMYIYKIESGSFVSNKKMILIK